MPDILESLGLTAQGGYASPDLDMGGFAAPSEADSTLAQAKVLARLRSPRATGMDRFAAGLGAKTGRAPGNKFAAVADGAMAGFSGAYNAGRTSGTKDVAERMKLLKELFGMERQLRNDRATQQYRQDSLDVSRERNRIYAGKDGSSGRRGRDPLLREKTIRDILKEHPSQQKLTEDDALLPSSPRKLKPEDRKRLEDEVAAERARLESLDPNEDAPAPARSPRPVPADRSIPSMVQPGVPAPASPALPAPVPAAAPEPAPGPAPLPPRRPAEAPRFDKSTLVPAAIEKMKQGIPMEAIIQGAKQKYGVELTPDDFGQGAPQPPAAMPSVDPMGNAIPGPGAAADPGVMGILQSLFG